MLKKKKTTASGKLVLVKSVRRHWTSGGCPLSADRSGTETAQPQNEILCSKGLGGRCPGQASGEENHKGIFFSAGLCVLTQAYTICPLLTQSAHSDSTFEVGGFRSHPLLSYKFVS